LEHMQATLHACFADGRWVSGLDATLWSWRALRPLLALCYRLFCRLRPHLAWLPHPDGRRRCIGNRCATKSLSHR
jgi:hypothetical protein